MRKSAYLALCASVVITLQAAAQTSGDDTPPANPEIELLTIYHTPYAGMPPKGYLRVDTKGKAPALLQAEVFDNHDALNLLSTIDLLPVAVGAEQGVIIPFDITGGSPANVIRLSYRLEGDAEATVLPYWESGEFFDYMSDLPVRLQTGWGSATINKAYGDNAAMMIGEDPTVFKKGFGIHATGWAESTANLSKYYRFATSIGGQKITNPTRANNMQFGLQNGNVALVKDTVVSWKTRLDWSVPINNQATLRINVAEAPGNGNTNNVAAIGAPRLYYYPVVKPTQEITWSDTETIRAYKPAAFSLDATASSGLNVDYRIVSGTEYAAVNGNTLSITSIPAEGSAEIVVEAYQPGDAIWGAAPTVTRTYRLFRGAEVERDDVLSLSGSQSLDELIIYADREKAGQVSVKSGVVNVKHLVLKYTFIPGEWNYLSFPSAANLDEIADFGARGYSHNSLFGGAYYVQKYDSELRSQNPEASPWVTLDTPRVEALKGYAVGINDAAGTDPVEVSFTFNNVDLDLSGLSSPVGLALDLTGQQPNSDISVSVAPVNVDGDALNIKVHFRPDDLSSLPLNYERALEEARITFVGDKRAMRLTLPDQTPAKVVFFDAKGKKALRAVRYVSPMAISLDGMKRGKYLMRVEYGNASRVFEVEL